MNRNFGKLNDGAIVYAPDVVRVGDEVRCTPTAADYAACGWSPVVVETPTKVGVDFVPSGWAMVDGVIRRTWEERAVVAPVKLYSVEEIIYGLIQRGVLAAVKAVVGDYWELLTMRETIAADNEIFAAEWPTLRAAIVERGIMSEDALDAVLADAEVR